jgi:hypothetical protein
MRKSNVFVQVVCVAEIREIPDLGVRGFGKQQEEETYPLISAEVEYVASKSVLGAKEYV